MEKGLLTMIIGLVSAVIVLPVLFNVLAPSYTLNSAVNDSVAIVDVGDVGMGQTAFYPINGQLTGCGNATAVYTVPGQCNVSTAANGTVQVGGVVANGATLFISYAHEDASYLDTTVERNIAGVVFVMVVLGLFIYVGSMMMGKGGV